MVFQRLLRGGKMKKTSIRLFMILFFLGCFLFPDEKNASFLKVEQPSVKEGKYRLLFNLNQIEAIINTYNLQGVNGFVEFADSKDLVQARLGKIENGKIVWIPKIFDNEFLLVKFHRSYYKDIVEKIEEKSKKPGFQILLSDAKTQVVLKGFEITFCEMPDLIVELSYPVKISSGLPLKDEIAITVKNNGALAAKGFELDLVISRDKNIPLQKASASELFQEDGLLKNGRITIDHLDPGEKKSIQLSEPVMIPQNTPPGKYYLSAVIDPGNVIDEFNEDNNIFMGFMIVEYKEPKKIILELINTEIKFNPSTYGLQVVNNDIILSDGKDWRKCRIKAYLYQFTHVGWKDHHWEISTLERGVWEIYGGQFCKTGGKAKELKITVNVRGGSKIALPISFSLILPKTEIIYEPSTKKMKATSFGNQIIYIPFWKVCKVSSHIYQFTNNIWTDFYLEVNTQEKKAYRVTNGHFCKSGGTQESLPIQVKIEE
jgi:hypothetical protein